MSVHRIYYNEFRRELERGPVRPLYLLSGAEGFLKEEGVAAIMDRSLPSAERNLNLETVYAGTDVTGQEVGERAQTMPFFNSTRVIIVRQVEKWLGPDVAALQRYASHPSPSTVLILVSGDERLTSEGWKAVAAMAYHVECYPMFDNQIPEWILRRGREQGKLLDRDAVFALIELAGQSLADLDNEIKKIASFAGAREQVSEADVRAVAGHSRPTSFQALQWAVGERNARAAVRVASQILAEGAPAPKVLGSLLWHLRMLYAERRRLEEGEPEDRLLASHRSPAAKHSRQIQWQARSSNDYPAIFKDIIRLDENVKSGRAHWELDFLLMILALCERRAVSVAAGKKRSN